MKLKIFTDLELLKVGYPVDLLVPFLGTTNPEFKQGRLRAKTFEKYCRNANHYFEFTNIEECDVCLLPIFYSTEADNLAFERNIRPFLNIVEKSNKKIFIFLDTFVENFRIDFKNAIIFDRAISKSKQQKNVYSYPLFFEDYMEDYSNNNLAIVSKKSAPVVGFCGYSPPLGIKVSKIKIISFIKLLANYAGIMKYFPSKSSHSYRARVIISLIRSKKVDTNFRIKQIFAFGPSGQLNTGKTTETDVEFRRNFVNNILESNYTLCVRGLRNTSIRFFETMCCGKIPLFINTDCVLPFDFIIDWKMLCVWVEEKNIGNASDIVADFHKNISNVEFIELQKKMRFIWEEYLSADGFFKNLKLFLEHQENICNS